MCGIVGYVGAREAAPILLEGLHRLEYRGYDSAGIALTRSKGALRVHKATGRVRELEARLPKRLPGKLGIAHTRWATHGEPCDRNAHPHTDASGRLAVVHNGIVENASVLRARLEAEGVEFRSDTDSEVLAHLIAGVEAETLGERVRCALQVVEGAYGLAVISADHPGQIVVARNGSPVLLGVGEREMLVASDVAALVRHTQRVVYLDDGELAVLDADGFRTYTLDAEPTSKESSVVRFGGDSYERGSFEHFMLKEIHEQPEAVQRTLRGRLDSRFLTAHLGGLRLEPRDLLEVRRVKILGCGSAYTAGQLGAHLIERLARLPASAEPASEFRYRNPVIEKDTLYVAVSQSGETFDTLAAVQEVQRKGGRAIGVVNGVGSTIARECGAGIYLHAGPEVAVVATKTFTTMAVAFALLALHLGRVRDLSPSDGRRLIDALQALPAQIEAVLAEGAVCSQVAKDLVRARSVLFIGRGPGYAIAQEAALKFKEITYLHAEAYPASELKHGPLALIDPETPTLVVLPRDELYDKNLSSIQEILARRGPVIAVTQPGEPPAGVDRVIEVPRSQPELDPMLLGIPFQLLAYHAALALDRDIDKPRNLAKSVTVE